MPDQRPHFQIPQERVQSSPIAVRGRAKPFSRPNYSAHGDYLRERTASLRTYVQETADAEAVDSVFLQVRTPNELPASGERQRLRSAGFEIVSLSSVDANSATVQLPKSELPQLERKVDTYASSPTNRGKSYLSIIEDIGPVPVEEKLAPELKEAEEQPTDCLLIFYSSLTEKERAAVLFAIRSFLARTGGIVGEQSRLSNGVTIVEARLLPSQAREAGAAFTTLRQVMPDHVFFVPDSWRISALPSSIAVEPPTVGTAVAVVDTGISAACPGVATVVQDVKPHLPPGATASFPDHGTFVASRVAYGDGLEQALRAGVLRPLCPLIDVPVIGVDPQGRVVPVHEGHLAAAIDAALPELPGNARVVNISLGTNTAVVDGTFSLVAQLLDKHARERDLLVVTTAGNIRDPHILQNFPRALTSPSCRIDSPGDSLLALTVGSFAKYGDTGALSRAGELSAFSRRGPGPLGGVKPDLVAHGGNCLADGSTSARIGIHGLVPNGQAWACDYGTSFAAPLVAAMGAQLFDHYANTSANLVRALLLHFTESVSFPHVSIPAKHLTGLGQPNVDAARWANEHSATFLYAGEITASRFFYVPFYVPACLAAGGSGQLRIKATVVVDPPVDPDNHLEYAKSRITVALLKPAEVGHSQVNVADDVVSGDKWCPLTQVDRTFHRSYRPGEWQMRLRLWTRDLPPEFRQKVAVVIEVIDDSGTLPVRTDVETEAGGAFSIVPLQVAA
jgi:Subtilase family